MILRVYSMQDRFSGFMQPTFELNDQVAIRNFEHAILATDGILHSHPADFTLCYIGDFDSVSGVLKSVAPPVVVVTGSAVSLQEVSNGNVK